jgi:2-oxo-4-hydroxy-4-carboxy-5-ureidoimidazoline decarboxylase
MSPVPHLLSHVNAISKEDFVRMVGPVFEHSPWIAESVTAQRPFATREALHGAMSEVVRRASEDQQLALIRAHPDLVGRAILTTESQGEQSAAGLTNLTPEEVALFDRFNREYQTRFGFPFVICARLNKKEAILQAFPIRLQNTRSSEIAVALAEICKIAELRLADLIA